MHSQKKSFFFFITALSSVANKVPILSIQDNYILNADGSITAGFYLNMQSMEGMEEDFILNEVMQLSKSLQSLPIGNHNIFFQIVFLNSSGAYDIHEKRMNLPNIENKDLYRICCQYDYDLFFKKSLERTCLIFVTVQLHKFNMKNISHLKQLLQKRDMAIHGSISNITSFMEVMGFKVVQLTGEQIYQYAKRTASLDYRLFTTVQEANYPLRRGLFLSDIKEIESSGVYYMQMGDIYFAALVMSSMPSIPAYISNILYNLDFPFIYTCNIMLSPQDNISKHLSNQRWIANMLKHGWGESAVVNKVKAEAIDNLYKDMATFTDKWHLCNLFMCFILYDANVEKLKDRISRFRTVAALHGNGITFFTEWLRKADAYVASIPCCAINSYDTEITLMPIAAKQVPMRGEYRGNFDETPVSVFQNRYNGLVVYTPFSEKQSRWSSIIIGPSGQGKSFLLNRLIFDLQIVEPFVQIIDMATEPSYETVTTLLGGNYYPVSLDEKFRVNIFDLAVGINMPLGLKMNYLMTALLRMQTGGDLTKADGAVRSLNNRAVQVLYNYYMRDEPKRVGSVYVPDHLMEFVMSETNERYSLWLEYRDYYIKKYLENPENKGYLRRAEVCQNIATPTLEDFVRILHHPSVSISQFDRDLAMKINREMDMYVVGGISIMFNGITLLDLNTETDIYTFFLGRLTDPNLMSVLLICYRDFFMRRAVFLTGETPDFMNQLSDQLVNIRRKKKLVLYDEFHNLKRDGFILSMIDKEMRQSRTFGVGIYLSTQEISDVLREDTALVSSCANKIFLRTYSKEEPTMRHIDEIAKSMGFSVAEIEMLKQLEFKKGEYADAMILQQDVGRGVVRYRPNEFIKWIATTDVNERAIRDTIVEHFIKKDKRAQEGDIVAKQKITAKVIDALVKEKINFVDFNDVKSIIKRIESRIG